jgi:hypothetical protein
VEEEKLLVAEHGEPGVEKEVGRNFEG